jgi:hypothetical protein
MIDFSSREYLLSHGREPRGCGRWAFEFRGSQSLFEELRALQSSPENALPPWNVPAARDLSSVEMADSHTVRVWVRGPRGIGEAKTIVKRVLRAVLGKDAHGIVVVCS